jgi:hypothetical protein
MVAMKKYSFHLPNELAAKLDALCEMYSQKKPAQVIADLVALAMSEVERRSGSNAGGDASPFQAGPSQHVYLLAGPFAEFHGLVRKHHHALTHLVDDEDGQPMAPAALDYQLGNSD